MPLFLLAFAIDRLLVIARMRITAAARFGSPRGAARNCRPTPKGARCLTQGLTLVELQRADTSAALFAARVQCRSSERLTVAGVRLTRLEAHVRVELPNPGHRTESP
jgi:hypothetical protein